MAYFYRNKISPLFFVSCRMSSSVSKYFVTTPIYYVNGAPHIGHLHSCLCADVLARMNRLLGKDVLFSTGTDEHGLKVQKAAELAKKSPNEYCAEMSEKFKDSFAKMDITSDIFMQTTNHDHVKTVQEFWRRLKDRGHITMGNYEGWYSITDESFVPPSQVKEIQNGSQTIMVSTETGSPLEKMHENNYTFPLGKFKDDILYWLSKDVVTPALFADDLRRYIDNGLGDLSISRPHSRLSWGVPVPDDESQTIYVWLDALVNYITAGKLTDGNVIWPADCHVIGKDILKFHGIYWPAFLIAAGYEPPRRIFCHSHWTVNHVKMSKSKGNVIDPEPLIENYGSDGLRYFLLRATVPHSDTNYSEVKIQRMVNAEIADTLGNLLNRVCVFAVNKNQEFPTFHPAAFKAINNSKIQELIDNVCDLPHNVQENFLEGTFSKGIESILCCLWEVNALLQHHKPWKLAKCTDEESIAMNSTILHIAAETLRVSGLLLLPVIPRLAHKLLTRLGLLESEMTWYQLDCFPSYYGNPNPLEGRPLGSDTTVLYIRRRVV